MELIKKTLNIGMIDIPLPSHLNRHNIIVFKVSGNCLKGENILNDDYIFIDFSLKPFNGDITFIPERNLDNTLMIKRFEAGFSNGALISTNYGGSTQDIVAFVKEVQGVAVACARDGVIVWEKEINHEKYEAHKKRKSNIAYNKVAVKFLFPHLFLKMSKGGTGNEKIS